MDSLIHKPDCWERSTDISESYENPLAPLDQGALLRNSILVEPITTTWTSVQASRQWTMDLHVEIREQKDEIRMDVQGGVIGKMVRQIAGSLSINHKFSLDLDVKTASYLESIVTEAAIAAGHLLLHTTAKGYLFTLAVFLYKVLAPVCGITLADFVTQYVTPFFEKAEQILLSQLPQNEVRNENPAEVRMDAQFGTEDVMQYLPLAAGIASIVAALAVGKGITANVIGLKEVKKWADLAKSAHSLRQGVSTLSELCAWTTDFTTQKVMEFFPESHLSMGVERLVEQQHGFSLAEHIRECLELTSYKNAKDLFQSAETPERLRMAVRKNCLLAEMLARGVKFPPSSERIISTLTRNVAKFAEEFGSMRSPQARRATPFHVSLYGKPGCGKSEIVHSLAYHMTDPSVFVPQIDRDEENKVTIYPRSAADPYWSNYRGQGVVILDDFGQTAQDTPADSEYLALIYMMTGVAWMPRMAAVSDKGTLFESKLVLSTTNTKYPTSLCVLNKEALWRRRNVLAEVLSNPAQDLDDVSRYTFQLWETNPKNGAEAKKIGAPMTYERFVGYCVKQANAFLARDPSRLLDAEMDLIRAAAQSAPVPLPDVVDVHQFDDFEPEILEEAIPDEIAADIFWLEEWMDGNINVHMNWEEAPDWNEDDLSDHDLYDDEGNEIGDDGYPIRVHTHVTPATCCFEEIPAEWWVPKPWESIEGIPRGCKYEGYWEAVSRWYLEDWDEITPTQKYVFRTTLMVSNPLFNCWRDHVSPLNYASLDQHELEELWGYFQNTAKGEATLFLSKERRSQYFKRHMKLWKNVNPWFKLDWGDIMEPAFDTSLLWEPERDIGNRAEMQAEDDFADNIGSAMGDGARYVYTWRKDFWNPSALTIEQEMDEVLMEVAEFEASRKERFRAWCEKHRPKMVLLLRGLGAAALAFAGLKIAHWFSWKKQEVKTFDPEGNVVLIEQLVRQTWSGYLQERMLSVVAAGVAAAHVARAGNVEEATRILAEGMVSGDSRTRHTARLGRLERLTMQGEVRNLVTKVMETWDDVLSREQQRQIVNDVCDRMKIEMEPQGGRVTDLTSLLVQKNLVRIDATVPGRTPRHIHGVGIEGKMLLVPYHLFYGAKDGDVIDMTMRSGVQTSYHKLTYGKDIKRAAPSGCVYTDDMAFVQLSATADSFKKITEQFVTQSSLEQARSYPSVLQTRDQFGHFTKQLVEAEFETRSMVYDISLTGEEDIRLPQSWTYRAQTGVGMCGAPLMSLSNHCDGPIIGIHVAGRGTDTIGYSAPVTREWLKEQLDTLFPTRVVLQSSSDGPLMFHPKRGTVNYSDMTSEDPHSVTQLTVYPERNLTFAAVMKEKVERVTDKTDIQKTPIHGWVASPVTGPSVLTKADARLAPELRDDPEWSPMQEGAKKYSDAIVPWTPKFIERAYLAILATLTTIRVPRGLTSVLSEDQAVNGIPGLFARLNPLTSAGIPFKWWRPAGAKGKRFLFQGDEETLRISDPYLRNMLDIVEEDARNGKMPFLLSYSNLKDERRSMAKIKTGSTRLFDCMPVHYNILARKYFGAFLATVNSDPVGLPSAVGINPLGPAWSRLYHRLARFGDLCVAGDYKAWDGKLDPVVMMKCVDVINRCMDVWFPGQESKETRMARRVIMEGAIHLKTLYGNTVCVKNQGLPSGVPFTADINSLANWFYLLIACQEICEKNNTSLDMQDFSTNYEATFYGDDHVWTFSQKYRKMFTFNAFREVFAEHGIVYTDALKKGGVQPDFVSLTEASYLKRQWKAHPHSAARMLAPIDKKTIEELTNWMRRTDGKVMAHEQTIENLVTALGEAYHHGQCYFEELKGNINAALVRASRELGPLWKPLLVEYDVLDEQWNREFTN